MPKKTKTEPRPDHPNQLYFNNFTIPATGITVLQKKVNNDKDKRFQK